MLGKGLESLIPQKGGQGNGDNMQSTGGNQNTPSFDPQKVMADDPAHQTSPAQSSFGNAFSTNTNADTTPPPLDFPIFQDELELPAAEPELALPAEESMKTEAPVSNLPTEKINGPIISPLSQSSITIAARNATPASPQASGASALISGGVKKNSQSLVGAAPATMGNPAIAGSVFHIETDKIVPNPSQPRRHFDEAALQDLAYSIREFGVLQPLVVTKHKKETPNGLEVEYELIAGERRLMAAKLLGLKTVPAIIRDVDLEREKLELAVIENIQREQLNAIETARAFERLRDEFKMTQREIAAKLGKSREVVANTVRLLDLPGYAQEALERGQLSESNARFLLAVVDQDARKKLFDDILMHGLTTRDVKDRVALMDKTGKKRGRPKGSGNSPGGIISPEMRAIQDELSSELGAPVEIEKKANTGKITITFYSEEELENILRKIKEGN